MFTSHLNACHPTIKFEVIPGESFNFTTRTINFVDLTIWIDDAGYIQTTLYSKPCRVISYLLPSSSHPSHVTKNIPFSLAYRLKRIESVSENLLKNLATLKSGWCPVDIDLGLFRMHLTGSCYLTGRKLYRMFHVLLTTGLCCPYPLIRDCHT